MKTATRFVLLATAALLVSTPLLAQTTLASQNLTVQATLGSRARLDLGTSTLTFPDADPATVATLTAPALSVQARARVAPATQLQITVLAAGDFAGATATIPASDISWTATGTGFAAGGLNTLTAQNLANFTGPGNHTGTQTYQMPNSWAYAPDSYAMTVTYTLAIP
jgi:hypothetical protein